MNINVMEALKTPKIDFSRKVQEENELGQSFATKFNKMLEDNKSLLKEKEKLEEASKESSKKSKDGEMDASKEVLNRNPILRVENREIDLKTEAGDITGSISQELAKGESEMALESLVARPMGGGLEDIETEAAKANFNLNLEEVKNNLSKALGKESLEVPLRAPVPKEGLEVLEGEPKEISDKELVEEGLMAALSKEANKADGENISEKASLKEQDLVNISKGSATNKDEKGLKTKIESDFKDVLSIKKENLDPILKDELETIVEDSKGSHSMKKDGVEIVSKDIKAEETVEDLDPSKINLEANIVLDRMQNSIAGLRKEDEIISLENLQRAEDSMIKFIKVSKEGDTSVMKVKLYPEELGSIDISLKFQNGKLIADIMVESEKVKVMFLNNSQILNKSLLEQDIPLKNINISLNEKFDNFGNFSGQGKGRGTNQEASQDGRRNLVKDSEHSPIDNMRIEKINKGLKSLDILV